MMECQHTYGAAYQDDILRMLDDGRQQACSLLPRLRQASDARFSDVTTRVIGACIDTRAPKPEPPGKKQAGLIAMRKYIEKYMITEVSVGYEFNGVFMPVTKVQLKSDSAGIPVAAQEKAKISLSACKDDEFNSFPGVSAVIAVVNTSPA